MSKCPICDFMPINVDVSVHLEVAQIQCGCVYTDRKQKAMKQQKLHINNPVVNIINTVDIANTPLKLS